jgi:hypothetical protein
MGHSIGATLCGEDAVSFGLRGYFADMGRGSAACGAPTVDPKSWQESQRDQTDEDRQECVCHGWR